MMKGPKPGLPAHWLAYVTCEDVDTAAKQAAALGGSVLMAPFDVPTVGRMAIVLDAHAFRVSPPGSTARAP